VTVRGRARRALLLLPLVALGLSGCIPPSPPVTRTVTYSLAVDGAVVSDVNELARVAAETYANPQGWRGAGIQFVRVDSGGDFTLMLANPRRVETYDPVCSYLYSCTVGRYVVINDIRFAYGSPAWPGPLDWYRKMVINHETGHWLGLGHAYCPAPGAPAPVMQQQSIDMQGCRINAWPLPDELAAVRR
jgi:hypothetical protein